MTSAMAYRGPDCIDHWTSQQAALGHCMLRTTKESLQERQPLQSDDGSIVLVMDGTLSNWEELRRELLSRSARLRTRSDSELVLRAYEIWGEQCPHHIEGEFAFVLWDSRRQRAFCARDHAGRRSLHYHWDGKRLIVASDIAGALAGGVQARPNRGMFAELMAGIVLSKDETIWQEVLRLPAAYALSADPDGMVRSKYWSPPSRVTVHYRNDDDYVEHYRTLLFDCVRRSSRSHLRLGCEVSGGLDSSAVFAVASKLQHEGRLLAPALKGYTLKFEETGSEADEIAFARAVGQHSRQAIAEVPPFLPPRRWFQERSRADCDIPPYPNGAMGLGMAAAATGDGCRVILNGSGGDEWLEGNLLYYAEQLAAHDWSGLGRSLREDIASVGLAKTAWWFLRFGPTELLPPPLWKALRTIRRVSASGRDEAYWLSPELRSLLAARRTASGTDVVASTFIDRRGVSRWLNNAYSAFASDLGTKLAARAGYEPRSPLHDRRFIEFAFATPDRIKRKATIGKYTHRRALAGLLPDMVVDRMTKAEFTVAFARQLDGMANLFEGSKPDVRSYLDLSGVDRLFDTYRSESYEGNPIWKLWGIFGCMTAGDLLSEQEC